MVLGGNKAAAAFRPAELTLQQLQQLQQAEEAQEQAAQLQLEDLALALLKSEHTERTRATSSRP